MQWNDVVLGRSDIEWSGNINFDLSKITTTYNQATSLDLDSGLDICNTSFILPSYNGSYNTSQGLER
jgi:hypothetical protein